MKFAHNYEQALRSERYPPQWLEAAIQYKELKKAIKKVEQELYSRGLPPAILNLYWHPPVTSNLDEEDTVIGFHYMLRRKTPIIHTGLLGHSANCGLENAEYPQSLSPRFFLVVDRQRKDVSDALTLSHHNESFPSLSDLGPGNSWCNSCAAHDAELPKTTTERRIIEIPLSYDAEFFHMVKQKLIALEVLQIQQESEMNHEIQQLALRVSNDIQQSSPKSKSLIYAWREIFRLYLEFQIFFSTDEKKAGQRDVASACQRFSAFEETLAKSHISKKLNKSGQHTLASFLSFNKILLRNIKFLDINTTALRKILKKFDKHTALHAQPVFFNMVRPDIAASETTAKAVCCAMSRDLIGLVPQLDDYLCPICFTIAFKPVRLRCGHIFCIRCLVIMQRRKQSRCALCRDQCVLDATGENFDRDLELFLMRFFPREVKVKLRENQRASNIDFYGEVDSGCSVM
ncbi:hypothetical protein KEM54_006504 [Ascosphaera aggregata]|nr:hypothetical protein KEM54_006504 [Ascosphaera aggregata]